MGKKFNFEEAREKAIKAADQELERGLEEMATEKGTKGSGTFVTSEMEKDTSGTGTTVTSQATSQMEPVPAVSAAASGVPTAQAQQQAVNIYQEPTQNINIPIPISQHTRLAVIKAHTRQTIKDLVVQAIDLWLDVQEGKKVVSAGK